MPSGGLSVVVERSVLDAVRCMVDWARCLYEKARIVMDDLLKRVRLNQASLGVIGTITLPAELHHELVAEVERLRAIVDRIDQMRREEGDSVTIVYDNPDFAGPSGLVIASGGWCGFAEQRYFGENLANALVSAVKDREAREAAKEK